MEEIIITIALWFGLYTIVTLSLNLEYGFAGIPNFGRALAVLMGAVAVGGVVNRLLILYFGVSGDLITASAQIRSMTNEIIASNPAYGIGLLLVYLITAAVLGAVTGALFILPSAKLSEDYLAITLLAISEVMFMVCNYDTTIIGGYYGVSTPDVLAFIPGEDRMLVFTVITLLVALVVYIFVGKLTNSPFGRLLRAMRENESVVEATGKSVMMLRIKAVSIGSAIASLAGALYSLYSVNVIATSFSRVEWTFYPFLMILLGGAGNNRGVVVGTLTFVIVKILLTIYKHEIRTILHLPFEAVWLEYILFGLLMYFVLLYRPEGLIKEKPIFTQPVKKIAAKIREAV
ncbi:branched-chain amino acid ABC transporter permease [Archaeoglobus neptunius]|uniref:branched-chain amino acid ABC transporter permease n=1 Tax=Archaeoglobus neptunius TaxID=2798580 RepID=UPI0019255E1B|nr:branched-chain amino acid ABC transporter permease [Archaeoglobus neptunius]